MLELSESLLGRKAKILVNGPNAAGLSGGDTVELVTLNGSGGYNIKTLQSAHPNGFKTNGVSNAWNWYVAKEFLELINEEETKMETTAETKAKKPRAKRATKSQVISGLDSKYIGAKVKIMGTGRFNDIDFKGDEEGLIISLDTNAYSDQGGSFVVEFAKPCLYGRANVSPKYLLLVSESAVVLDTRDIKKLPKKHRELLAKEKFPASREYIRILCAQVGVSMEELPEITYLSMVTEKEKVAINGIFFEWKSSDKAKELMARRQTLSNEAKDSLSKLASKVQQDYVNRIQNNLRSYENNAVSYYRNVDTALAQAAEERRKLDAFLKSGDGKSPANMLQYVEDIIKSGWFTFEEKRSKITSGSDCVLAFSTRDVNINYTNKAMGIDINLDLGKFLVKYLPYQANIVVDAFECNLICSGAYTHPHISGADNGGICWGNGKQTYLDSMQSGNPVRAFETFQSLIQAYGESPFHRIENFVEMNKTMNKTVKDTTGGDFVLNSLTNGFQCRRRFMPKAALGSPDIVKQNDDFFFFRTWKRKNGTGHFLRTKDNPNELVDLTYVYNNLGLNSCTI